MKPGFYFIAASHDAEFQRKDNVVSMTDVWVSDLALMTRTRAGKIEGFVLGGQFRRAGRRRGGFRLASGQQWQPRG